LSTSTRHKRIVSFFMKLDEHIDVTFDTFDVILFALEIKISKL